jgi:hypothetical protein
VWYWKFTTSVEFVETMLHLAWAWWYNQCPKNLYPCGAHKEDLSEYFVSDSPLINKGISSGGDPG